MLPEAIAAMTEELSQLGNPSSLHNAGRRARRVVEESREQLAEVFGARASEVIFTSGGTEADNLAVKGLFWARQTADPARCRVLTTAVEHHAVLDSVHWLTDAHGARAHWLEVDSLGIVSAGVLRAALAATRGPSVVVAHSWGGSVATLGAAGPPGAAHLIYIAAVLTDIGHPVAGPVSATGRPTMRSKIVIDAGAATVIDPEACLEVFYPDVPGDLARAAAARLRPFAKTGYDIVPTDLLPAWKTTPVTYAVCTQDRMIHPDTQREMAAAAGAAVVEWPASHSPFLSRPDLVAGLVAARARDVSA